jgi:uncharacterized protein YqiB (DUF1249 family)
MLADSYIVPECDASPGSFGGLMALYESNYIKLSQLIGTPENLARDAVSVARRDFPLHLTLCETAKYTRELRLTYLFDSPTGMVADPDLGLRLYLDANLVEVTGWAAHHRHNALLQLRRRYGRELDRRWSRNMMLSKWLDFLQDAGHRFLPVRETVAAEFASTA